METRTKELRYQLSEKDWIDVRITKDIEKNEILKFSINLCSTVEGQVVPVIRYDNAHGYAHIDKCWETKKQIIQGLSNKDVVKLARKDLVINWKKYREMAHEKYKSDDDEETRS